MIHGPLHETRRFLFYTYSPPWNSSFLFPQFNEPCCCSGCVDRRFRNPLLFPKVLQSILFTNRLPSMGYNVIVNENEELNSLFRGLRRAQLPPMEAHLRHRTMHATIDMN